MWRFSTEIIVSTNSSSSCFNSNSSALYESVRGGVTWPKPPTHHNNTTQKLIGGCQNWSRWSGPQNLDQIWTKSGHHLDTIWTGFLKTGAKIPGKILCPRTRKWILVSALSEKFKFCLYRNCVRTGKEELSVLSR
jgi:hypothetical protein